MPDRILITGAAGFIGSNLCRHLLENTSYSIVSLDRLDEVGSLERLADLRSRWLDRLHCVWHDLRATVNPNVHDLLRPPFRYVAHLAAGSHVDRSVRDPLGFIADNVLGTGNLLEYVRHHLSPEKTLVFSTDEVYGSAPDGVSFDESARFNALNPYAASKAAADALCPAWANTYGMPIVVTRATNIWGPAQSAEKFIPLCIGKVQRGELVQIHAQGSRPSTRFYVHVDDVSRAVLTVLEKGGIMSGGTTGIYNISGAEELSNLDVAQRIASVLSKPLRYELVDFVPNRPRHDMRYAINGERLRALGWEPSVSFDDGLARLIGAVASQCDTDPAPAPEAA